MAYKPKPTLACDMPANHPLRVLVLNGSLKHEPDVSNTHEVAEEVLKNMGTSCQVHTEVIRLADQKIPVGLGFRESDDDDWPAIVGELKKADVVIFATPIWWGGRSSLMQRVIERLDALDEEYHASGRSAGDDGDDHDGADMDGLHAAAGVRGVLGGRGGIPATRGSWQAEDEQGHAQHGGEHGTQSRLLRSTAEGPAAAAKDRDALTPGRALPLTAARARP